MTVTIPTGLGFNLVVIPELEEDTRRALQSPRTDDTEAVRAIRKTVELEYLGRKRVGGGE